LAELRARHDVTVEWLPYELRPEPVPLPDMSGQDGDRFRRNWALGVAPLARQLGVEMRFPPYKPRSRHAHEVAEYARERGAFEAARVALFRAFFVDGRDLGDRDVLVAVGASVGLDPTDLRAALESGRYTRRVVALEGVSARLGVSAVPTVVIGDLAVEGVRPYDVLRRVLEQAERDGEATTDA
jgi:predicted DsbA family dithiol-disulfide isomerase